MTLDNNGDATITDLATGLMWGQFDSGAGLNWEDALAPPTQHLQPQSTPSSTARKSSTRAALQTIHSTGPPQLTTMAPTQASQFTLRSVKHSAGWDRRMSHRLRLICSTSMARAHNAVTRKAATLPTFFFGYDFDGYPVYGHGPQGDVIRIYNYVRPVRGQSTRPCQKLVNAGDHDCDCDIDFADFADQAQFWQNTTQDYDDLLALTGNWLAAY